MFYLVLFSLLMFGVILEVKYSNFSKRIFVATIVALIAVGGLRYGSGTDYFAYKYHFTIIPSNVYDAIFNIKGTDSAHLDIGFRILMSSCKMIGVNYDIFIAFLSVFTTGIIGYTIYKNSNLKNLSFLIFYAGYFLVYMNSTLRQGIAMSLFFFAFYQFYQHHKYIKYIITILIAFTFHNSVVIGFVVLAIDLIFKFNLNTKLNNIILMVIASIFCLINFPNLLVQMFNLNFSYSVGEINWLPLIVRIFYLLIIYGFIKLNQECKNKLFIQKQIYVFFISTLIYICLSRFSIASRITDYLMMLEIILIPNLIYDSCKKIIVDNIKILKYSFSIPIIKYQVVALYIGIIAVLFIKDIKSFTYQETYFEKKLFNYEYVTIFNKEKLYVLREMDPRFPK